LGSSEREIKHQRVRDYLQEHRLDGVVLSRRCNFSWYTSGAHNHVALACEVGNSLLLVGPDRAWVITNNIEAERLAGEELAESGLEVVRFEYSDPSDRQRVFRNLLAGRRVAADAPVEGIDAPLLGRAFDRLRWSLTDEEIQRYRRLCDDVVGSLETVARKAQPGQTENELAGCVASELWRRGCTPWLLLVGGDDRVGRFRHPLPTDRPIRSYLMLVTCAERDGLIAACSRLAAFGGVSAELAEKHRAVVTVDAALISATQPGVRLGDIFATAQEARAKPSSRWTARPSPGIRRSPGPSRKIRSFAVRPARNCWPSLPIGPCLMPNGGGSESKGPIFWSSSVWRNAPVVPGGQRGPCVARWPRRQPREPIGPAAGGGRASRPSATSSSQGFSDLVFFLRERLLRLAAFG